jgi:hypothetical protein
VDYHTYLSRKTLDKGPRLTLLLQVDGSSHAGEGYRFTVEGGPWDTDIWTRDLFDPASLGGYRLRYQLRGEDIELKPNALASKWEDVDALLGRGVLIAMKAGDTTHTGRKNSEPGWPQKKKQTQILRQRSGERSRRPTTED